MMYYNQLETGRRIQKLRRERYLTQEELAIKLNISDRHTAFEKPSVVQLEQIFTIDKSRVQRFLGQLTQPEMYQIEEAISSSLNLNGG